MVKLIGVVVVSIAFASCMKNSTPSGTSDTTPPSNSGSTSTQESAWAAIGQLEAQAKALVKADGCSASADCATGAIGRKACGSPRDYVVYCKKTTDVAALNAKLDEIVKAETAYNTKYQVVSTCEMRLAPEVEAIGGSCRAK